VNIQSKKRKLLLTVAALSLSVCALLFSVGSTLRRYSQPIVTGDTNVRKPGPPTLGTSDALFENVALSSGLKYRWKLGVEPYDILESVGYGCALLDYNNDGKLDILLIGSKVSLFEGSRNGKFRDVSKAMGLSALKGSFSGCAVGDTTTTASKIFIYQPTVEACYYATTRLGSYVM
jgi:hypothetical protein